LQPLTETQQSSKLDRLATCGSKQRIRGCPHMEPNCVSY